MTAISSTALPSRAAKPLPGKARRTLPAVETGINFVYIAEQFFHSSVAANRRVSFALDHLAASQKAS